MDELLRINSFGSVKQPKWDFEDAIRIHEDLKSGYHLPKKNCFICSKESPLKIKKNDFYFILKALFVLKIFKFSRYFCVHFLAM